MAAPPSTSTQIRSSVYVLDAAAHVTSISVALVLKGARLNVALGYVADHLDDNVELELLFP